MFFKIGSFLFILASLGLTVNMVQSALNVTNSNDFDALADALFPSNTTAIIHNVNFVGDSLCIGLFSGGLSVVPGLEYSFLDEGVVLASGNVDNLPSQDSTKQTTEFFTPGDEDLDNLLGTNLTQDACVLEIEFLCNNVEPSAVYFNYVFGSDEYQEYYEPYNDVFGLFLNGDNLAIVPGTTNTSVGVDTVNAVTNSELYVDNYYTPYDGIEMNGFTHKLRTDIGYAPPGMNILKVAIADDIDAKYDSWVLLEASSISCEKVSSEPSTVPSLKPFYQSPFKTSITPSRSPLPSSPKSSVKPSILTPTPSKSPSSLPSFKPSITPSKSPSRSPSPKPSVIPSKSPSIQPSSKPSATPSNEPSKLPSKQPSRKPSGFPQGAPSKAPSAESPSHTPVPTSCKSTKGEKIRQLKRGKSKSTTCKSKSSKRGKK